MNSNIFHKFIIEWIIDHHHIFNEMKIKSFQYIIEYLDIMIINKFSKKENIIHAEFYEEWK